MSETSFVVRMKSGWLRRLRVLFGGVVVVAVLSGCVAPEGDELFAEAKVLNLEYRETVAEVQLRLIDAEWVVKDYGSSPQWCGDNRYSFDLSRWTPDGYRIGEDPVDAATKLADWLIAEGWDDVYVRTYSGKVTNVLVEASNPGRKVEDITIDFLVGPARDIVTVRATSTCNAGDYFELHRLLQPFGDPRDFDFPLVPEMEYPTDTPIFGYTPEGKPL